jgi:hypothetical protein
MAKRKKRIKSGARRQTEHSWTRLLLALTLVPMMFGVGLILAWAFDIYIFGDSESQPFIGMLFILFGFAASNALQRNRELAIGWFLLAVADLISLMWAHFWVQISALIVGLAGLGFLTAGFYQRYKEDQIKTKKK